MNVQRFRDRARGGGPSTTSRSVTAYDKVAAVKDGLLYIDRASAPSEVAIGGRVSGTVQVTNDAQIIQAGDEDRCNAGKGYEYDLRISTDWNAGQTFDNQCIGTSFFGGKSEYHNYDFQAPTSAGTYTITYTIETTGSLQRAQTSKTIIVREGGDPNPEPGGCSADWQCPGNYVCVGGSCQPPGSNGGGGGGGGAILPCFIDPNNSCTPGQQTMYGVVGTLLLIVLFGQL